MKGKFSLTLALIFGATCAINSVSQSRKSANSNRGAPQVLTSATPAPDGKVDVGSTDSATKKDVPAEFAKIDFTNLSYPVNWKKKRVRLKNGSHDYNDPEDYWNSFVLGEVYYVDFTGDGKKEAIVELIWEHCGGTCEGHSHLFYFYEIQRGRLTLLQHIKAGSLFYGCGLKSFTPSRETLTIEVFRECSYSDGAFISKQQFSKYEAHEFTRFTFKAVRGKFALKKSEVLPHPSGDVLQY
ncbi:MAG: hypothetical protein QOF61_520 [Acidobacteriota bacterium]|nr:hypothetical protein [Acidobacteriota bacterium]